MLADIQFNRLMPEASARTAEQAQQLARALQGHATPGRGRAAPPPRAVHGRPRAGH